MDGNGVIQLNTETGGQGVIKVAEIIEREAKLREWRERAARDDEWVALKQWWQAQRQLHRATTPQARQAALQAMRTTWRCYRTELRRALPKWAKVQEARRMGSTYHLPEENA